MRRATVFMSVAAVMFSAATALAQKSFAGHWVVQPGSSTPSADGGGATVGGGDGGGGRGGRGGGAAGGGRAGGAGRGNGGALGGEFWVEQDAKTMTVIRINTMTFDTTRTVYNLDGTPTKNAAFAGPGGAAGGRGGRGGGGNAGGNAGADTAAAPFEPVSTAKWNKDELEITTTGRGGNTILRIYFVKNALFVQTVRPGNNGAAPTETLTIYDKKK
jgi:hypothetical protein